jgi:hypothetical protein
MSYDLIIVGAGIAGLRVGIESLKRYPGLTCCILEKYGYVGGRVVTYRKDIPKVGEVQWENGAGRISTLHKRVLELFKIYNLTFVPIGSEMDYIDEKTGVRTGNKFTELINIYLRPLEKLAPDILANHTIKEILDVTIGKGAAKHFYEQFPYYAEIHTLRADIALYSFKREMGTNSGFGVCAEGLSSLTDKMRDEFIGLGGKIIMDTELIGVLSNPDTSISLKCKVRDSDIRSEYVGKSVVLALHHNALREIEGVKDIPVLKRLTMMPLLRMYAVFPVKGGKTWFSGLPKVVSNSSVRYIIPVSDKKGIIMISYTDGADAKWWMKEGQNKKYGEENVKDLVMTEIRRLFPDRVIPNPLFFKQHPWTSGCTYWLPGIYNIEEESMESLQPLPAKFPNLFMCNESFAVEQCWIESALRQSDKLMLYARFRGVLRDIARQPKLELE